MDGSFQSLLCVCVCVCDYDMKFIHRSHEVTIHADRVPKFTLSWETERLTLVE